MTAATKRYWAAILAVISLLLPVIAWSGRELLKVDDKLDAQRFVRDSIARQPDRALLLRIDQRVSAMYCASVPPATRAACR